MTFEKKIIEFSRSIGCDLIGFSTASCYYKEKNILEDRLRKNETSPFEENDINLRIDPSNHLPQVKSIISVGFNYTIPFPSKKPQDLPRGRLARFVIVKDYHTVIKGKLSLICDFMQKHKSNLQYKYFVDTGPMLDRAVAYRSGLGTYGRNNCFINHNLGSFLFLGEILTNLALNPSPSYNETCRGCNECLRSCPTNALASPYSLNYRKCLSYITQDKAIIPRNIRPLLEDRLYGCDTCQEVCPHNKTNSISVDSDFLEKCQDPYPELIQILHLSNKEFKDKYKDTPFFWRGKTVLQRNAIIVLGNLKAKEALPYLKDKLFNDPRPEIRGYSAWALSTIDKKEFIEILSKAYVNEKNDFVKEEIEDALKT